MKFNWKMTASLICYFLGVVGWGYVGGWLVLSGPIKSLIVSCMAGNLTIMKLIWILLRTFIYLSIAGAIWCVGYMSSNFFKELD